VCTMGDTAHIDTIFKFLPHTRQHGCIDILHSCNECAVSLLVQTSNDQMALIVKKNFFSFSVAVSNPIKVGPLVFLLYMFVITENIMKHPVLSHAANKLCQSL
jgi:hypothetical protein